MTRRIVAFILSYVFFLGAAYLAMRWGLSWEQTVAVLTLALLGTIATASDL